MSDYTIPAEHRTKAGRLAVELRTKLILLQNLADQVRDARARSLAATGTKPQICSHKSRSSPD